MTQPLILYTNPESRGRIARWMLEEVGATYTTQVLAYGDEMKAPWYLAINPLGKVPTLRHGDAVITETAAICAHLADAFPDAGLAPPAEQRGAYYRWLFFGAGPVENVIANRMCGLEVPADKRAMVGTGEPDRVIETLAAAVAGDGYIAGARFTAADVYVGSLIAWGMGEGNLERRGEFTAYWRRLAERPAFQRAKALDDAASAPSSA